MKEITFQLIILLGALCTCKAQSIEAFVTSQNKYNTDVWIEKVIIGNGKTEVKMQIKSDQSDMEIYLYPPESEQSVILQTFEKTYQLRSADSIPFYPEKVTVLLNETKTFSLFYDEIAEYVTELDIIERVEPFESGFSFFNVRLSKEKEKQMSLRFSKRSDFERYFKRMPEPHPLEGFWEIDKTLLTTYKKKNKKPSEEKNNDSIAIVKEDGLLRAYYLNGEDYNIAFKELDNYFVFHSDIIETANLLEVSENRNEIKLFGLLKKTMIYPKKKENKKIEDVILRSFWKKG